LTDVYDYIILYFYITYVYIEQKARRLTDYRKVCHNSNQLPLHKPVRAYNKNQVIG